MTDWLDGWSVSLVSCALGDIVDVWGGCGGGGGGVRYHMTDEEY